MRRLMLLAVLPLALAAVPGAPAQADHTNPGDAPLSRIEPQSPSPANSSGDGVWQHVANFGPMQGTDIETFTRDGVLYVAGGTLGQGPAAGAPAFVGQRILKLRDRNGKVNPEFVADHGSATCPAPATGVTGLQHDVQAVPQVQTEVLIDTTDSTGRCHDTGGGGIEIIDVSELGRAGFRPKEIGLVRLNGLTHTVTADIDRPGILYNSGSDFGSGSGENAVAMAWMDVIDIRSCLGLRGKTLEQKRKACRPAVYRYPFNPDWTSKRLPDGSLTEPANCHDITAARNRLYCAALNATIVLDTTRVLDPKTKKVAGKPLPCTLMPGTSTGAMVTNCFLKPNSPTAGLVSQLATAEAVQAWKEAGMPRATGIRYIGGVNHPGRDCTPAGNVVTCNTNMRVPSDQEVSVSHEADPTPDGRFMLVTDERGGGVIPIGASCAPGVKNPYGNGGLHVYDLRKPSRIQHATADGGGRAVYIGGSPTPALNMCTIHVIEQVPGEARIIAAYYDGGTKVLDYAIDDLARWTLRERAAYRPAGANTWASEVFHVERVAGGKKRYWFVSNGFSLGHGSARGLDIFHWTGPANPYSSAVAKQRPGLDPAAAVPPVARPSAVERWVTDGGAVTPLHLLGVGLLVLAGVVLDLRRRNRRAAWSPGLA